MRPSLWNVKNSSRGIFYPTIAIARRTWVARVRNDIQACRGPGLVKLIDQGYVVRTFARSSFATPLQSSPWCGPFSVRALPQGG
jgi:hypothetical protein